MNEPCKHERKVASAALRVLVDGPAFVCQICGFIAHTPRSVDKWERDVILNMCGVQGRPGPND